MVTCEHLTRRVTRTEHAGSITVLIDQFEGRPLNAPNDVVVHSDGAVWFTDPGYGILMNYEGQKAEAELPTRVYRLDPATGAATVAADDLVPGPTVSASLLTSCACTYPIAPSATIRRRRATSAYSTWWMAASCREATFSRICPPDSPTACARTATATCGPVVGWAGAGHGRGALPDARGGADWPHHPSRTLLKPLLRRCQEEPPVHDQ